MKAYRRSGATVVAAALAAVAVSFVSPASYSASSSVLLSRAPFYGGTGTSAALDSETFASAIALFESDAVLGPVAELVDLPISQVREMASKTRHPDSTILDIDVIASNPETAAAISNAIAMTMSSIAETTQNDSISAINLVRTATPPTAPVPISWPTVLLSGLLAGAFIALVMQIEERRSRTSNPLPVTEPALELQ